VIPSVITWDDIHADTTCLVLWEALMAIGILVQGKLTHALLFGDSPFVRDGGEMARRKINIKPVLKKTEERRRDEYNHINPVFN
jgi:hypothetical protein